MIGSREVLGLKAANALDSGEGFRLKGGAGKVIYAGGFLLGGHRLPACLLACPDGAACLSHDSSSRP